MKCEGSEKREKQGMECDTYMYIYYIACMPLTLETRHRECSRSKGENDMLENQGVE